MAMIPPPPSKRSLALAWMVFVGSAAVVASLLQLGISHPTFGAVALIFGLGFWVMRLRARRELRRLVMSGDVTAILAAWGPSVEAPEDEQTLGPLFRATALAAYGMTGRARQVLALARQGRAWDEALEHRLFLDALLNALDGDRSRALESASNMRRLPLPASLWARARVVTLRMATEALARAFARQSKPRDAGWLRIARRQNPLIALPLGLAEVSANIQRGNKKRARKLLSSLPQWPKDSAYIELTQELEQILQD